MIQALFGEIKGLLDKDYLFASLLPTIVFIACLVATLGGVVGFEGSLAWVDSWTQTQKIVVTIVAFTGTIVFAYIVSGLRVAIFRMWSGLVKGPFTPLIMLGECRSRNSFDYKFAEAHRVAQWQPVIASFVKSLQAVWNKSSNTMSAKSYAELQKHMAKLRKAANPSIAEEVLTSAIILAFKDSKVDGRLERFYAETMQFLERKAKEEEAEIINMRFQLDRDFGPRESIRGTRLGNVVEAYYAYPFLRYGIEGTVMWPHLQYFIPEAFAKRLSETKTILDFCLVMATLGVLYAVVAITVGPWLWLNLQFWTTITAIALIISYAVYYRLGVLVTIQYGDLIRASFDLFRGKLSEQLIARQPNEVEKWKNLSRLLAYGQTNTHAESAKESNNQRDEQHRTESNAKGKSFWKTILQELRKHKE
ncbi:MAG: hypothetical protein P0111_18250 [Nitrospira sp.]|nr:hypothetical protein [Nitrospira sp.]